jgi:Glycine transporter
MMRPVSKLLNRSGVAWCATARKPGFNRIAAISEPCHTQLCTQPRALLTTRLLHSSSSPPAKPRTLPRPPPPPEDGLTRYPSISSPQGILRGIGQFATVVFSYNGCVTAGTCGMDLLGCVVVGTVTAVGGGTIRDAMLGNFPAFWMKEVEVCSHNYQIVVLCKRFNVPR